MAVDAPMTTEQQHELRAAAFVSAGSLHLNRVLFDESTSATAGLVHANLGGAPRLLLVDVTFRDNNVPADSQFVTRRGTTTAVFADPELDVLNLDNGSVDASAGVPGDPAAFFAVLDDPFLTTNVPEAVAVAVADAASGASALQRAEQFVEDEPPAVLIGVLSSLAVVLVLTCIGLVCLCKRRKRAAASKDDQSAGERAAQYTKGIEAEDPSMVRRAASRAPPRHGLW